MNMMRFAVTCVLLCILAAACTSDSGSSCGGGPACEVGETCVNGACVLLCTSDAGCPKNQACGDRVCADVPGAECAADAECTQPTGCETADGAYCEAGRCHYPASFGHCDDGNPCTVDGCVGAGDCTHDSTTRLGEGCSAGGFTGVCAMSGTTAACLRGAGQACLADNECAAGLCECGNSTCTSRVCALEECDCQFDVDGNGTCDGNLDAGVDDADDTCGPSMTCSGYGRCTTPDGVACSSGATCDSGYCAVDLCCDEPCDGSCMTCLGNPGGVDAGTCAPAADGLDPRGECSSGLGCTGAGACWDWDAPGLLENDDRGAVELALDDDGGFSSGGSTRAIGADADGNVIVVWDQHDGTYSNALANSFRVGFGWSGAVALEQGDGNVSEVRVAVSPNGNAIAMWRQYNGAVWVVWENRYTGGVGWTGASMFEPVDAGAALPAIQMDGQGNAWAVYRRKSDADGGEVRLMARRFASGVGWAVPTPIDRRDATYTYAGQSPDLAIADDGSAVVVWTQHDGNDNRILHTRFPAGAMSWTAPTEVSPAGRDGQLPAVAGASEGWLVLWEEPASADQLGYAFLDSDGGLLGQGPIPDTAAARLGPVHYAGPGNFVVMYDAYVIYRAVEYARTFNATTGWLAAESLDRPDEGSSSAAVFAVTAPDTVVAILRQRHAVGTDYDLLVNRFTPAAGWSGAQVLRSQGDDMQHAVVALPPSGAIAIWTEGSPASLWHAMLAE